MLIAAIHYLLDSKEVGNKGCRATLSKNRRRLPKTFEPTYQAREKIRQGRDIAAEFFPTALFKFFEKWISAKTGR